MSSVLIRNCEFSGNLTNHHSLSHHRVILESKSIVHGCSNSRFWSLNTFGRALELEYLWVPFFPGPLITFGVLPEFLNTSVFWKWLFVDIMCSCRSFCLHVVFFWLFFICCVWDFCFFYSCKLLLTLSQKRVAKTNWFEFPMVSSWKLLNVFGN